MRNPFKFKRLTLLRGLGSSIALLGLVTGGVLSCDSTAKFSLDETKFSDVQVVTAFPAHIDPVTRRVTRVCGGAKEYKPDTGEDLTPNGFELTVNMTYLGTANHSCKESETRDLDLDHSIKQGERIESIPVISGAGALQGTLGPNHVKLDYCFAPRDGGSQGACQTAAPASAFGYRLWAPRATCKKDDDGKIVSQEDKTRVNVALVIDHSGSTSGLVEKDSLLEDPSPVKPPQDTNKAKSDRYNNRISAVIDFLDSLNWYDRAIAYYFDEDGVQVAATNSYKCVADDTKQCSKDADCAGAGDTCIDDDSLTNDTFSTLPDFDTQQMKAFGPMGEGFDDDYKKHLNQGLALKAQYKGKGRAPIWTAVDTAYRFLDATQASLEGPKHVVLVADGPDTCEPSEQYFNFRDLTFPGGAPTCRAACAKEKVGWAALIKKIEEDQAAIAAGNKVGPGVIIDVVQFQSPAAQYKEPDPRMMELACRTGGTYQFLNTEDYNKEDATALSRAFKAAMQRVRNSLSGNWRIAFEDAAVTASDPVGPGQLAGLKGQLKIENAKFASLAKVFEPQAAEGEQAASWDFTPFKQQDRRLLFRRAACETNADCGGTGADVCGGAHCGRNGMCLAAAAGERMPCGDANDPQDQRVCCGGACGAVSKCDATKNTTCK